LHWQEHAWNRQVQVKKQMRRAAKAKPSSAKMLVERRMGAILLWKESVRQKERTSKWAHTLKPVSKVGRSLSLLNVAGSMQIAVQLFQFAS